MAWTCVFSKQSLPPALCGHTTLHPQGASRVRPPFSLSYGGNLPSSLTTVRPSPRYSLPDHLCRFGVRAARNIARGFSRQHRITHFAYIGSASDLRHVRRGFAYVSPYILSRGLPSPRLDYLPASPHRLTTISSGRALRLHRPEGSRRFWALSITRFVMGADSPVREYQPVVHRLRLSASP